MNAALRIRHLPRRRARGSLIVDRQVGQETLDVLRASAGDDGRHEALVFWAGIELGTETVITHLVVPATIHGWGFVRADEASVALAAREARAARLGLLAQVHSHPGCDTRHSSGDDALVLMPFEGMFSLVVGNYGDDGMQPAGSVGVHQFQDGRWVWVTDASAALSYSNGLRPE